MAVPSKRRYYHEQWITGVQRAEQTGTVGADGGAVSGQRIERNVYAKTREECEEKLAVMIEEVKKQIAAEKEKIKRKQYSPMQ